MLSMNSTALRGEYLLEWQLWCRVEKKKMIKVLSTADLTVGDEMRLMQVSHTDLDL